MSEPLVKALLRRHPEYVQRLTHWEFLRECYEGGREWFDENLFQYWKEGTDEFAQRKKRAYRFNHSREVVDLVNKYLFRAEINRASDASDVVQSFWKKSTKEGLDIDYLMRDASKRASIYGRSYLVVDSNRVQEGVLSVAEAKAQKIRTFAYLVNPIDVLDMSFDVNDQLNWILIRETARDDASFEGSTGFIQERFRLWDRNEWQLYQLTEIKATDHMPSEITVTSLGDKRFVVTLVGSGSHGLGRCPVIIHDHSEHDSRYFSPSLINDIAYQDRAVANYLSNLDAIIQDQTFSQLAIPAQALMPGEEEQAKDKLLEMGTKRVFLYNAEAGTAPMFLSPDPKQAQMIIAAIRQVINEIYHSVGMAGERTKQDNSMGIDNSSGVAKAYDFDRINALLTTKAKSLQRVEYELAELVMLWNGEVPAEGVEEMGKLIKYAETFDIRGLSDEFDVALKLSLVSAPETARRVQMRLLIDKLMPVMSDSDSKAIDTELKSWPVNPLDAIPVDVLGNPNAPTQGAKQPQKFGSDVPPAKA